MRDLAIAYGNSRQAKKWVNKTIQYDDLKARLRVTIRTTESAEEYAKMSKAQRDAVKAALWPVFLQAAAGRWIPLNPVP